MQVTKDMLGSTGIPSFSQCHCLPFAFKANSYSSGTPGSSVHGISLARILEWVAMPFSRQSSWPKDWTHVSYVSCIGRQFFTTGTTCEVPQRAGYLPNSELWRQRTEDPAVWSLLGQGARIQYQFHLLVGRTWESYLYFLFLGFLIY